MTYNYKIVRINKDISTATLMLSIDDGLGGDPKQLQQDTPALDYNDEVAIQQAAVEIMGKFANDIDKAAQIKAIAQPIQDLITQATAVAVSEKDVLDAKTKNVADFEAAQAALIDPVEEPPIHVIS